MEDTYPNWFQKDFRATAPKQTWAGDITYLWIKGRRALSGRHHGSFARRLVGGSTRDRLKKTGHQLQLGDAYRRHLNHDSMQGSCLGTGMVMITVLLKASSKLSI